MKRRILLLCFMLGLCVYGIAEFSGMVLYPPHWANNSSSDNSSSLTPSTAKPDLQKAATSGEFVTQRYIIRHVATGKYWGNGCNWGTRASLIDNPEYLTLIRLEDGRYYIESQTCEGEAGYYFNGDYMDNPNPIALTIEQQANGHYSISNGTIYYGYDGDSFILDKTETDPTSVNVQWDIISVADATTALNEATESAPKNATFLISDANFGRNNRDYTQWTFDANNKNNSGDVTNYCVESWHAVFVMSQTLSVPNGIYGLTAQGFYRQDGSDEEHLPVIFANESTGTFPRIAGTENNMNDASVSFSAGMYAISPVYVEVTDGTLSLGARLEDNTLLWCIWDNFTLMYYGSGASITRLQFNARFDHRLTRLNELQQTVGITATGSQKINEALSAYTGIDATAPEAQQQALETQMDEAVHYAEEGIELKEQVRTLYNKYRTALQQEGGSNVELASLLISIGSALENNTFDSNVQLSGWIADLNNARQQYITYEYNYWFDFDDTHKSTTYTNSSTLQLNADLTGLSDSFHAIHIQVTDNEGKASSVATRSFIKIPANSNVTTFRCWFDNDVTTMLEDLPIGNVAMLDVSMLKDGFHVLHVQANDNAPTPTKSYYVIKQPQTSGVEYMTLVCTIDGEPFRQERVPNTGGAMVWEFDISSLKQGLHNIQLQGVTPSGAATSSFQTFFLRSATNSEIADMKLYYYIDNDNFTLNEGRYANGGFHFDLDVSQLTDGLHRIAYFMSNGAGITTKITSQFFMKTPVGGNGITQYQYWLNEDYENTHSVSLSSRVNPFQLISLLPVETQPIRSSCFEFRVENEQPVIYAKNDIHVRFHEATGRFTDVSKQYVDESVRENVDIQTFLDNENSEIVSCPAINEIKWFAINALSGDSLSFKVDKACTLQLFSPNGLELYSAHGVSSVYYGGIHADMDGVYYLALHDVTGCNSSNIILDYQHIDRYALLDYTPNSLGVYPSLVNLFVFGNGFDKLTHAELTLDNNSIEVDSISCINKSMAYLQFSLHGDEISGDYDLSLHFNDGSEEESLIKEKAIHVEGYDWGTIEVRVKTERRLASPYPVVVSVTNTGNVSKLFVPFNTAFTLGEVSKVVYMNFLPDYGGASGSAEEIKEQIGYTPWVITNNLLNKKKYGLVNFFFIPELGPHETKDYIFGFEGKSHCRFTFYAWTGIPLNETVEDSVLFADTNIPSVWNYLSLKDKQVSESKSLKSYKKAPVDRAMDAMQIANGMGGTIPGQSASIGNSVTNTYNAIGLTGTGIIAGAHLQEIDMLDNMGATPMGQDPLENYRAGWKGNMANPFSILNVWSGFNLDVGEEIIRSQQQQAECDTPMPEGHEIEILNPGDPNDIIGYKAESGNHAVRNSFVDAFYTIEFENDPEIATAAAHTIVVRDTLDNSVFDLSSFKPTSIKLGHKTVKLNGEQSSTITIDMRPDINVIAQMDLKYNKKNGIAVWTISSLDPMTMGPTDDAMQGVLPINADGNGCGELCFDIKFKNNLEHDAVIQNRASIVFDNEGAILTPTWTNIVDNIPPTSQITSYSIESGTKATITWDAADVGSGVWKSDLYMFTESSRKWSKIGDSLSDTSFSYSISNDDNYGFCVVAVDSAGNVEPKELQREVGVTTYSVGDANNDGVVDAADVVMARNFFLGDENEGFLFNAADLVPDGVIDAQDIVAIRNMFLGIDNETKRRMRKRLSTH